MLKTFIIPITWMYPGIEHGYANGYVAIPRGHKYYGVVYDDIPVEVHGGLTFGCFMRSWGIKEEMLPKGLDLKPDDYIVGFDTCHAYDDEKLDEEWCLKETASLAKQLYDLS